MTEDNIDKIKAKITNGRNDLFNKAIDSASKLSELIEEREKNTPHREYKKGDVVPSGMYKPMSFKAPDKDKKIDTDKIINSIRYILKGIDKEETTWENGWWETSTGAEFGKEKLEELINFITLELGE